MSNPPNLVKLPPRPPSWHLNLPSWLQDAPKLASRPPTWLPRPPKMAPRSSNLASKVAFPEPPKSVPGCLGITCVPFLPLVKMNKPRGRCLKNRVPGGVHEVTFGGHFCSWLQDGPPTPQPGAKIPPGPSNLEPRWHQTPNLEPRWPPDPATWSQNGPQTPLLGAKMDPRRPNLQPRYPPDPGTVAGLAVRQLDIYIYIYIKK